MKYASVGQFLEQVAQRNPGQPEFLQAVTEVMESLWPFIEKNPKYADFALLGAYKCDEYGNCWYKGTMRNFNVVMATAADTVIAECEYIVPVGDIEPENVHTYGMCVNYIVEGDRK